MKTLREHTELLQMLIDPVRVSRKATTPLLKTNAIKA